MSRRVNNMMHTPDPLQQRRCSSMVSIRHLLKPAKRLNHNFSSTNQGTQPSGKSGEYEVCIHLQATMRWLTCHLSLPFLPLWEALTKFLIHSPENDDGYLSGRTPCRSEGFSALARHGHFMYSYGQSRFPTASEGFTSNAKSSRSG